MKFEALQNAARVAKNGVVLVATADGQGTPHVAAAHEFSKPDKEHVSVAAWFHPRTVSNVGKNLRISVVVWSPDEGRGYQLIGKVENVRELATVAGYTPAREEKEGKSHLARKLLIRVDEALDFKPR